MDTIKIGTQNWTAENLNVSTYKNGDAIPHVQDLGEWANLTHGAWCYYENKPENGSTYGRLYNWYAVNDPRGLAPAGYHIPGDDEWTILTGYLGGSDVAGTKLKSTSGWLYNGNGTNISGFAGHPGGCRGDDGEFSGLGGYGYWWSSSESKPYNAWYRLLYCDDGGVGSYDYSKGFGLSVRCIRD